MTGGPLSEERRRALDVAIAERVFRLTLVERGDYPRFVAEDRCKIPVPFYSSRDFDAWLILVHANDACRCAVAVSNTPDGTWIAQFGTFPEVEAETLPLAICRAALLAADALVPLDILARKLSGSPSTDEPETPHE